MYKTGYSLLEEHQDDYLKVVFAAEHLMTNVAYRLDAIADALAYFMPGSPAVAELEAYANDLRIQEKRLSKAIGDELSANRRQAEEHSGNMLRACLAGVFTAPGTTQADKDALKPLVDYADKVAPRDTRLD